MIERFQPPTLRSTPLPRGHLLVCRHLALNSRHSHVSPAHFNRGIDLFFPCQMQGAANMARSAMDGVTIKFDPRYSELARQSMD
jgi:hypothetical protein